MKILYYVALGCALLREFGVMDFSICNSSGESNVSINSKVLEKQDASEPENSVRGELMPLFCISSAQNHRLARLILRKLHKRLDEASREKKIVSVQLRRILFQGIYWLPLYKRATCRYEVVCTLLTGESTGFLVRTEMLLSGSVALTTTGFCSVRSFCEKMADSIAVSVINAVRIELADRGSPQDNLSENTWETVSSFRRSEQQLAIFPAL